MNVVFLSEGYTSGQLGQFLADATNTANILLTNQPFAEYRSYINAYAIAVPSAESGADHPISMTSRDTYFNSTYDGDFDYIITIPPNGFDTNYNNGQGLVDALLNDHMPACDLALLLVNDLTLGGSDGGGRIAISANAPGSLLEIPVHESGHVLANLGDEYSTPFPGYPDIEEPNTTRETNRAAIKWNAWIATNTPVPTPIVGYANDVGLFEGAHYHATGWYRPKLNCRMGSFGVPFCEVCNEALVLSLYRQVRPIDSFAPATTNLFVTSTQALNFTLTVLEPIGRALEIRWLTNGIPIAGETNSTFTIPATALDNGTNTVLAQVTDSTPLVRTDTSNLLSQTLAWQVTVNLPPLELTAPRWLGQGKFAFRVTGVAPQGFVLETSTNLTSWMRLATNILVGGHFDYTNQSSEDFLFRAFRAVTPP